MKKVNHKNERFPVNNKKNPFHTHVLLYMLSFCVCESACVCVCACLSVSVAAAEASLNVAITTSYGNVVRKCHQSQKWKELS